MKLGERVSFTYKGARPFTGQIMTGELVAFDPEQRRWLVYRDEQWRHADAVATWVNDGELIVEDPVPK